MKLSKDNILVIGDSHLPFEKKGYLEFCKDIQKEYGCGLVVHIGDLVDNHSISYHEHDPDLWSPEQEMKKTDERLALWFKAFPELYLTRGNHDCLVDRKAKTAGLPKRAFKQYRDIWKLPKKWHDDFQFIFHDVLFRHSGPSGDTGHLKAAIKARQSVVVGHAHSVAGIAWNTSTKDKIFGMNVGCGIDRKHLAFAYGKDMENKPIVGCGVILKKGQVPIFIPMNLGHK